MLEVCVDLIESAIEAAKGGAQRIELCSSLSEGGLTPTCGLLKAVKKSIDPKISIFCMLRPRRGNDFIYSDLDMECIIEDLHNLCASGADGFVFGSLNESGGINIEQCKTIIRLAGNIPVTFHRAFDFTVKDDLYKTADQIIKLGFKRILTSGFEVTAEKGIENIKKLILHVQKKIIIMPGAGINSHNIRKILDETTCIEFHASARIPKVQGHTNTNTQISLGGSGSADSEPIMITSSILVRELVQLGTKNFVDANKIKSTLIK